MKNENLFNTVESVANMFARNPRITRRGVLYVAGATAAALTAVACEPSQETPHPPLNIDIDALFDPKQVKKLFDNDNMVTVSIPLKGKFGERGSGFYIQGREQNHHFVPSNQDFSEYAFDIGSGIFGGIEQPNPSNGVTELFPWVTENTSDISIIPSLFIKEYGALDTQLTITGLIGNLGSDLQITNGNKTKQEFPYIFILKNTTIVKPRT